MERLEKQEAHFRTIPFVFAQNLLHSAANAPQQKADKKVGVLPMPSGHWNTQA